MKQVVPSSTEGLLVLEHAQNFHNFSVESKHRLPPVTDWMENSDILASLEFDLLPAV
jgi:hypothetical protein